MNIQVLGWLTGEDANLERPLFSVRENIVEVKIPRERVITRDELDTATGRLYGLAGVPIDAPMPLNDNIATTARTRNPGSVSSGGSGAASSNHVHNDTLTLANYKVTISPVEAPNNVRTAFTIPDIPRRGTIMVFRSGLLMSEGAGADYTISGENLNIINFNDPPENDENILFSYVKCE